MKKFFVSAIAIAMAGSVMAQPAVRETVVAEEVSPSVAKSNWVISSGGVPHVVFVDHCNQRKVCECVCSAFG